MAERRSCPVPAAARSSGVERLERGRDRRRVPGAARPVRRGRDDPGHCSRRSALPYVGAGVLGSAASMDKAFCKAVLRDAGIAVARSLRAACTARRPARPRACVSASAETLGWPVFVKPANLGSSVGITKVHGPRRARRRASSSRYRARRQKVLVERFVGRAARSSAACSATSRHRVRRSARSCRTPSGTTTRRSTTRAAPTSSSPPTSRPHGAERVRSGVARGASARSS